jgi:hypothetical protein
VASIEDVRRIALGLPEVTTTDGRSFAVAGKPFAWPWLERVDPKRARVPNLGVIGVRIAAESEKEVLIEMDPTIVLTAINAALEARRLIAMNRPREQQRSNVV